MEAVEVIARFEADGKIFPTSFTWKGQTYPVISVGRRWTDSDGQHILVMVPGDNVFELLFNPSAGIWQLVRPGKERLAA
jgi:hypothetical protein